MKAMLLCERLEGREVPASFTWAYTGGGSGSWASGANWVGGTPPSNGDEVVLPAGTGNITLGMTNIAKLTTADGWDKTITFTTTTDVTIGSGTWIEDAIVLTNSETWLSGNATVKDSSFFQSASNNEALNLGVGTVAGTVSIVGTVVLDYDVAFIRKTVTLDGSTIAIPVSPVHDGNLTVLGTGTLTAIGDCLIENPWVQIEGKVKAESDATHAVDLTFYGGVRVCGGELWVSSGAQAATLAVAGTYFNTGYSPCDDPSIYVSDGGQIRLTGSPTLVASDGLLVKGTGCDIRTVKNGGYYTPDIVGNTFVVDSYIFVNQSAFSGTGSYARLNFSDDLYIDDSVLKVNVDASANSGAGQASYVTTDRLHFIGNNQQSAIVIGTLSGMPHEGWNDWGCVYSTQNIEYANGDKFWVVQDLFDQYFHNTNAWVGVSLYIEPEGGGA